MKPFPCLLLLVSALSLTAYSRAEIERVVEKSFDVKGVGTVRLETSGGTLNVVPGSDGVVRITAREKIRASSDADADERLTHLELTFDQTGNDVRATAKYNDHTLGFHFGSWPPVRVDFVVTVPASYAADLRTSGGGITVGDLAGAIEARTSGGPITLGNVGSRVDASTSGGGIKLGAARGDVKLETSGGSITVGHVAGGADLSTSGGSIRIEAVEHAIRAHTSGGSIQATILGPLQGDCLLSTSGGSIRVGVDKAAAFQLDASTSGGGVSADGLTITLEHGSRGRDKLVGAVNGGGPLLKLRSSGGGVSVNVR